MAVLANPCRDRHEAGTGQLTRPWYFAWALGGRSSRRRSAKHGGEDRAEPYVAPDGAGRQGFSELHVLRPAPQVNVCVRPRRMHCWRGTGATKRSGSTSATSLTLAVIRLMIP